MLARYQMKRGLKLREMSPALREGVRQDSRKHTQHVLRPSAELAREFLTDTTAKGAWSRFKKGYLALLRTRFAEKRDAFDELAKLATERDVFIGCSCPTQANPTVRHCHTWLALEFMRDKYPNLVVQFPEESSLIPYGGECCTSNPRL